jgi:hypothetical protein
VAARRPDRVARCATIVAGAPYDAEGLDFFDGAGMGQVGWVVC